MGLANRVFDSFFDAFGCAVPWCVNERPPKAFGALLCVRRLMYLYPISFAYFCWALCRRRNHHRQCLICIFFALRVCAAVFVFLREHFSCIVFVLGGCLSALGKKKSYLYLLFSHGFVWRRRPRGHRLDQVPSSKIEKKSERACVFRGRGQRLGF